MAKAPEHITAHWSTLIEGLQASPREFYTAIERAIEARKIPGGIKRSRVQWREGGALSAKREYLRVERYEHLIDICGAPFGTGFFVSWWGGEHRGCLGSLAELPFVGEWLEFLFKPTTYYRIDTGAMFQTAVHAAVREVIEGMTKTHGLRALGEAEWKPVMREFWQRGGLR